MTQTYRYLAGAALLLLAASSLSAERLLDIPLSTQQNFDDNFNVTNLGDEATLWKWESYNSTYPAYANCYKYGTKSYDDYLTLKTPVHLTPGMAYRLGYESACFESGKTSSLEVKYGTSSEPESLELMYTQTGILFKNRYNKEQMDHFEQLFEVPTEGDYYISFHAIDAVAVNKITLDEAGNPSAPASISDLEVTADPTRALKATLSFTVPSLTVTGNTLESVSKVVIKRNGEVASTKTGQMPGDEITWTDENSVAGDVTYSVTVYSGTLESMPASKTVFVGPEVPMPVTDLTMTREGSISILSWSASTKGIHGIDLDPAIVRYKVERINGNDVTLLTEALDAVTYRDDFDSETRTPLVYRVTPVAGECVGESASTPEIWIGAVSLPLADSFANASFGSVWTSEIVNGTKSWEAKSSSSSPSTSPQDEDGGYAYYNSYNASREYSARLITPEILASSATNPMLEFYLMGNTSNYKDFIKLQIQKDSGEWTDIEDASWYPNEIKKADWAKIEFPLKSAVGDCEKFRIAFTAVSAYGNNMAIDNVSIYNLLDNDLAITSLQVPETVTAGNEAFVTVSVRNKGANAAPAGDYTLSVSIGDNLLTAESVDLEAGDSHDFTLSYHVDASMISDDAIEVAASITYAADQDNDNNAADKAYVTYACLDKATVTILDGVYNETNGDISLTWEPAIDTENYVETDLTENFESFDKGFCGTDTDDESTKLFGNWKAVKNDTSESAYWFYQLPAGFTIFDSSKTSSSYAPKGLPASPQVLISSGKPTDGILDQWLISPELTPFESATFNVEFKMQPYATATTIEVAYSETDDELSSFITAQACSVTSTGTMYTQNVSVPGTAKYIALRHKSESGGSTQAVALDDIKIKSVCDVVLGYNVYEIGVGRITETPVAECSYTVPALQSANMRVNSESKDRTFAVTALYDGGESALGTPVRVVASGIESLVADKHFSLNGNVLMINAAEADIYTVDGIFVGHAAVDQTLMLGNGVYILKIEGKSYKFVVR